MKNFSLKTKESFRRSSRWKRITHLGAVTALLIACIAFLGGMLGTAVSVVTLPVYRLTDWMSRSTAPLPAFIRARTELLSEINSLKEELSARSGSDATIARLSAEQDIYRGLLGVYDDTRIAAGVIARPPRIPYDSLLIDRGSTDGVTERAIVYHAHDRAIGFVSKVFPRSALVTLFSSPGVVGSAYIFGPDLFVNFSGEGGGVMRLSVPQGVVVQKGNAVVLPGIGMGVIGVVDAVQSISTEPEQRAYVTLSAPIQSLFAVGVSSRAFEDLSYEEAIQVLTDWKAQSFTIDVPLNPTSTVPNLSATSTEENE